MKIKFLTVSLMLILPFSVFAANTVVEKAVIESNNTYKAKYNLEDMTEFNQASLGIYRSRLWYVYDVYLALGCFTFLF